MEGLIATTKHRRGRRTGRQERALADPGPALLSAASVGTHEPVQGDGPLILDIGFGAGRAVVAMAMADPATDIIAVDTHTPGIGDLLASIAEMDLRNVYVVHDDVRNLLDQIPRGRLSGVRTFFPDPWPKKRHHRRRLITRDFADALALHVRGGGFWHIATDWTEYAEAISEQVGASGAWRGGRIRRPNWRPETRYERRGRAAGRAPIDLWFERVKP